MKDLLKIRVEAGYLNLFENAEKDFFVTRQVHLIQDLESRNGDTTRELTIPRDNRNIRLLGYNLPSFKSDFAPYQLILPCSVELGGIPVLNDSLLFVFSENLTAKTITIEVLGSQVLFFTLLSDDSIRDLEFDSQEWELSALATKTITDEGFLYGNAVYVDNLSAAQFLDEKAGLNDMYVGYREVEASGGWFYFHTIVDRILEGLEAQGLMFDTSILDDNDLYNEMVFLLPVTQLYDNYSGLEPMYSNVLAGNSYGYSGISLVRFDVVESEDPEGLWDNSVSSPPLRGFTLTQNGLVSVDIHSYMTVSIGAGGSGNMIYDVLLNGVSIYNAIIPLNPNSVTEIDRRDTLNFNGSIGDLVVWQTTMLSTRGAVIHANTSMKLRRQQGEFGTLVFPHEWFPDISQKDFIRELFKFFHIVPVENDRLVTWKYWDKIAESEHQDITPFIDSSQGIEQVDYIEGYAQENRFTYTESDMIERIDTDHIIQMNKRLIPEKVNIIESKFIPCDINVIENSGRVSSPLFNMVYEHVDDNKIQISDGDSFFQMQADEKPHNLEVGDHIFVWNLADEVTMKRKVTVILDDYSGYVDVDWDTNQDPSDWDYLKYTKTGIGFQIGYRTGSFSGQGDIWDGGLSETLLNWNDVIFADAMRWPQLVAEYYRNFARSVFNPILGHVWLNIPIMDFIQLDFMRPAYALGTAYYMNVLEQYKMDGSVRAELFRIGVAPEEFTGNFFTVTPEDDVNLGDWISGDDPLEQVYTIENTGANTIRVSTVLSGDEFLFFEASEDITLDAAEIGTITIYFIGSEVIGTNNCIINFQAQGAINAIRNISAQVQTIDYTLEPTDAQFLGNWFEGDVLTQAYTITNTGTIAITLTGSLSTASDGYSLLGTNPITLQPTESAIQTVQYVGNATDVGTIDCTLIMTESTGFQPVKERGLTVNVFPQQFTIVPVADVDLGDWATGDPPLDQVYTVTNSGSRSTVITCVYFGTGWSLVGTNPIPLAPNTSGNITFRFSGQPVADVYLGFVDFINEEILTYRRNARANVPAVTSFTVTPVEDVQLIWDTIGARPTQRYTWTNTGNTRYSGMNGQFSNINFEWVGEGGSVNFDLEVGGVVEYDAQYVGVGENGNYLAIMETYVSGGLHTSRNIACEATPQVFTVNPTGDVDLGDWEGGDPIDQIYTIQNTGLLDDIIDVSLRAPNGNWSLVGTNPIPIPAGETRQIILRYSGDPDPDDYLTQIDFVGTWLSVFRAAFVTVPVFYGYTVAPTGDIILEWDGVSAKPEQIYNWYNNSNTDILIVASLNNANHEIVGHGSTVQIILPRGGSQQHTVRYLGSGTIGNYPSILTSTTQGIGLPDVIRNIETQAKSARLRVEPAGFQRVSFNAQTGVNGQILSSEIHNDGNIDGIFSIEITGGYLTDWEYLGTSPVTVQPSESYTAEFRYTAVPLNSEYGSIIDIEFTARNTVIPSQEEIRSLQMQIPKLKCTPLNIPDLGEIAAGQGSTFFPLDNHTAAQITGLGELENDYGGTLSLNVSNYTILGGGGNTNRSIRYSGGNSGQKAVTVIWTDDADQEVARWSCLVTPIG